MKKLRKIFVILLGVLIPITAYGATYTLISANYPINVNGQKIAVEPLNYNGTTYLPLRQIAEAVGVDIGWNNSTKSVEINTVDVEELKKACVMIETVAGIHKAQGSGVYIDYDEILTANHVTEGKTKITVSNAALDRKEYDNSVDAAILSTTDKRKPVKIGDSDDVKIGDKVIIIASPQGEFNSVKYGKIIGYDPRGIMATATLGGGASGGAVFDMNGCLIGIILASDGTTEAVETRQLISPINDIRKAL